MCDENIEVIKTVLTKTVPTKTISTRFNEKKVTYETENFYIVLIFLLITISLLVVVSTHHYLTKSQLN